MHVFGKLAVVAATMVAFNSPAEAQIYKWVDDNGVVHYSDQPLKPDAEQSAIKSSPGNSEDAKARLEAANALRQEQSQAFYRRRAGDEGKEDEMTPEQKEWRQKSCTAARKKMNDFAQARRLYKVLPNGEKAYLTEAEILEARAEVQSAIQEHCD